MAARGRKNADVELVAALASGSTIREAAQSAGVGERTAYRRLENAEFRSRVQEARKAMFDQSLGTVASAGAAAAQTLRAILTASSESVQLGAARSVLELGSRLRENIELEERLSKLEELLKSGKLYVD